MRFLKNLQFIFKPAYWCPYGEYSKGWDIKLNQLLDMYKFENINSVSARIGGYEIRHYMGPSMSFEYNGFRPSRITLLKAFRKLKNDLEINLQTTYINENGQLV